jgi:hypothetical protein
MVSELMSVPFDREVLAWRRGLFQWEEELVTQLEILLLEVVLLSGRDKWFWSSEGDGIFTVKSAYHRLASRLINLVLLPRLETMVFKKIWSSPASSKIIAFS